MLAKRARDGDLSLDCREIESPKLAEGWPLPEFGKGLLSGIERLGPR